MDPRFTATNITAAVLAAVTIWVLVARFRGVVDSSWPLFYYVGLVLYSVTFPGIFDPSWIYAGVVCALLLRFEYMGGVFLKLIRIIEIVVLIYIFYMGAGTLVF